MQWKTRPLGYFSYTVLCCLCKRGDGRAAREGGEHHLFQFTPLREGRPAQLGVVAPTHYFNSRPCERGDGRFYLEQDGETISIHAPARGATRVKNRHFEASAISIHAPARGATEVLPGDTFQVDTFQFTPLREGRPMRKYRAIRMKQFQFTPLREGRRTLLPGAGRRDYFNSRPCERGDGVP